MLHTAFVLLSGGIDSTTCLYLANAQAENTIGVSINYGQRHAKEMAYAGMSTDALEVPHKVLDLSHIVPQTMLTNAKAALPSISYDEIKGVSPTYVPFRNGLMLAAVAALAAGLRHDYYGTGTPVEQSEGEFAIYIGAHAEDAQGWAYPDCTPEFMGGMANAIHVGTYYGVRLVVPLQHMLKKDIIQLGEELSVDWRMTWSCYAGGEKHCGVCPTCRARKAGFEAAGVTDPTEYAA